MMGSEQSPAPPQLLVSVRNAGEAQSAIQGGCDIVDVKEPHRGALGRADNSVVSDVIRTCGELGKPTSAALGELRDYMVADNCARLRDVPNGLQFAKLGLANCQVPLRECEPTGRPQNATWQDRLLSLPRKSSEPKWVAVAYADAESAQAPLVQDVLRFLLESETGFVGLLIDTYDKRGPCSLDCLSEDRLMHTREQLHDHGLFLAIAGKIDLAQLARLPSIRPDIVAIRGAACRDMDRKSEVAASRVAEFRAKLFAEFGVDRPAANNLEALC